MDKKNQSLLLGAHMSIAGGFDKAIERGESIGCTAMQIFTKSNRQWHAKKITVAQAEEFQQALKKSSIHIVIAHATYLINVGSPDDTIRNKSIAALAQELERCTMLGISYLVLHPGSYVNSNETVCIQLIAAGIDEAYKQAPDTKTNLLLETMAGQGSSVGHTLEQLATIIQLSQNKTKLGICLDTCHIFAAGYTFNTPQSYDNFWNLFDTTIGLSKLHAIHVNDSKKECGSHVDRHEDIGKGKITLEGFTLLFNDKRFFDIPKILETPKEELEDDVRNMIVLKKLISEKNKRLLHID